MSKSSDPRHARLVNDSEHFNAKEYEQKNVHSVYESIASHFSSTRYKPWPLIPAFVNSLPSGSVGADLGCGNGKYLSLRSVVTGSVKQEGIIAGNDIITLGLDRSANLIDLARSNVVIGERISDGGGDGLGSLEQRMRNEVGVGDAIQTCYRSRSFDFALSIATIHHFSTSERRLEAVKELIRVIRPVSATTLTQVKHEQEHLQGRQATRESEEAYQHIAQQVTGRFLIYVWALEQRGESRRKFEAIPKGEDERGRDLLVPWVLKGSDQHKKTDGQGEEQVYQRFYHVFEQGELESLVAEAASQTPQVEVQLEISGWEKGNWYGIWQCIDVK